MAKRTSIATFKRWWRNTRTQSYRAVSSRLRLLLRPLFRAIQQPQNSRSGFVLPTAALLLLVVSLVIGAVLLRTINRTEQVIGTREDKVIYNAATPAIDRAKAKIEYMFTEDPRLPAGVPSEERLYEMMLNQASSGAVINPNPYLIGGEEQIRINGQEAPAWAYKVDSNGDGTEDLTVAYSITWRFPPDIADLEKTKDSDIKARARRLEVRNGPMSGDPTTQCQDIRNEDLPPIESGFLTDPSSTAILRKNFQIDAFVISDNENGTVTALEMQQDRQANRGNKWGAWFRSDLELFPGPPLNWNGAIRTDGSLFVGRDPEAANKPRLNAYLVSSPASCIYQAGKDNSIISLGDPPSNEDYQGQVVSALVNIDRFQGTSTFHIQPEDGRPITDLDSTVINPERDSVNAGSPIDIAVDPLILFTEDRTEFRDKGLRNVRDAAWQEQIFVTEGRVANEAIEKPVVDDFYRADDRYGPKPAYGTNVDDTLIALGHKTGEPIGGEARFTTLNPVAAGTSDDATDLGLDGYWERRAFREGMRVITGQRLELGNDPLPNPTDYAGANIGTNDPNNNNTRREHEALQRRAMRDNPAAVQATAIYHHTKTGDFPVAAVATTVHPGTAETLKRSAIFDTPIQFRTAGGAIFGGDFGNDPQEIAVDFFTGRGTNGWEFKIDDGYFGKAAVTTALQNLAHFAGDTDGAFPPTQDGVIHPYPELTKWGNFSNLRRSLDNPTSPESIADKTNQHTAAMTLGMLGYNLAYLDAYTYAGNAPSIAAARGLDAALQAALTDPRDPAATAGNPDEGLPLGATPEDYTAAVGNLTTGFTPAEVKKNEQVAQLLSLKEQTNRDRTYGFKASPQTADQFKYTVAFLEDSDDFIFGGIDYDKDAADVTPTQPVTPPTGIPTATPTSAAYFNCNFGPIPDGNNYFGFGQPTDKPTEERFLRVATAICGVNEDANIPDGILSNATPGAAGRTEDLNRNGILDSVKYPSLYYLFPKTAHNFLGPWTAAEIAKPGIDPADPYLKDTYVSGQSAGYQYLPVELSQVLLEPKPIGQWILPHQTINPATECRNDATADAPNPNCTQYDVVYDGKTRQYHRVAIKDTALFNGREMMNVRALNLDLELLKDERTPGGDTWIAGGNDKDSRAGGIVFAFREDAVREDAIARPAGSSWAACKTVNTITTANCQTNVVRAQDPPVNADNGISPKPVDFYADPDRRPHGFRLINGSDLSHPNQGGVINYGLTFVSDNSAYVQGNFNCHKSPGGGCNTPIEEFRQTISDKDPSDGNYVNDFYGRTRPQYNVFANPDSDSWRASELLVDALTILSDNFCDGSIEDGIITVADGINPGGALRTRLGNGASGIGRNTASGNPRLQSIYGCNDANLNYTSYLNQNRPNAPGTAFNGWLRENPADPASPIKISPNGNPLLDTGDDYAGNYFTFLQGNAAGNLRVKPLNQASPQRVNAVIISGTVPFRALQSSGGLHNFPRFLENWDGVPLNISGSLLQLNFSTAATAP
ncbi:MAG: hormogonium polysaccharide biosynthesis protein HpsA, partial [Geitlerinemataceae cyanobacterium]